MKGRNALILMEYHLSNVHDVSDYNTHNGENTTLADEELVGRCKKEFPFASQSFEALVQRHWKRIYSVVYKFVNNREDAEDITQDVFIKIYFNLLSFQQRSSFSSWSYRIAVTSTLDALDDIKKRHHTFTSLQFADPEREQHDIAQLQLTMIGPEEHIIQKELRETLNTIFRKLHGEKARILTMRDVEQLSYKEIASKLTMNPSTVKMRIHRARSSFQEMYRVYEEQKWEGI